MRKIGVGLLFFVFALSISGLAQLVNPTQKKADQVKKLEVIEPSSIKLNRTEVYVFYNPGLVSARKEGYKLVATVLPENATSKEVIWESSDPAVVEVSRDGYLTPMKLGSVVVTATTRANGLKAQCQVYVERSNEPFGNTPSNMNNWGYMAVQNDWIYFANPSDNMTLYKMRLNGSEKKKLSNNRASCINVTGNQIYYLANGGWVYKVDIYGENFKILSSSLSGIFMMATPERIFFLAESPGGQYAIYQIDPDGAERNIIDWNWPRGIFRVLGDGSYFVFSEATGEIFLRRKLNNNQWSEPDRLYGDPVRNYVIEVFSAGYADAAEYLVHAYIIDRRTNAIKKVGPLASKEKRKTEVLFVSGSQEPVEAIAEAEDWLFYCHGDRLSKMKKDGSQNQVVFNRLSPGSHFLFPVRAGSQPGDLWIYVYTLDAEKKFSLFKIRQNGMDLTRL